MRSIFHRGLLGLTLLGALASCASDDSIEYYPADQVDVRQVAVERGGVLVVDYRCAAETMWYCPGSDLERIGDTLVMRFPRVWFRDEFLPDAGREQRGDRSRVRVGAMNGVKRVVVADAGSEREVWRDGRFVGR